MRLLYGVKIERVCVLDDNNDLAASVAASLETTPALLPYMPALLADLWALGADPDMTAQLLAPMLPPHAHVLDLACGKGAVAVTLAQRLGCRVLGLDAIPAFLDEARAMAKKHGVEALCRFEQCDIRTYCRNPDQRFDAVILSAIGPVFGSLEATVGVLRQQTKPGGYIVIDDAWREATDTAMLPPPVAACPTHAQAREALTAHGDAIVVEAPMPLEALRAENQHNNTCIQHRVDRLAERHPHHAALFCAYASNQLYECYLLEHAYGCAVWILQTRP